MLHGQPNEAFYSMFVVVDLNEIWHVGRGRWVMHDGMQYDDLIQGQGQGHKPFKVGNPAIFRSTLRQSRPNKAGLECPSIHTCVRP